MSELKKSVRLNVLLSMTAAMILCCSLLLPPGIAAAGEEGQAAPLNPEFLKYQAEQQLTRTQAPKTQDGYMKGYLPSPVDDSHLKGKSVFLGAAPIPASYDLRTKNKLTPVRDQGNCGSCWTFSAMASLESYRMPKVSSDYSEGALNEFHGFDYKPCAGGSNKMATAYFARWSGPVAENDFPYGYPWMSNSATTPHVSERSAPLHIQNVIYLPNRANFQDNDTIKQALMEYGAVGIAYSHKNDNYNSETFSYYNPDADDTDHVVAIVGWDDSWSKDKFNTAPEGDGAFIVRNSWGKAWGDGGYFYMSYYDASLWIGTVFCSAQSATNYNWIYQYDYLGDTQYYGYGDETGWMANIFLTNPKAAQLQAVSLYAASYQTPYEIYIYANATPGNPISGTLLTKLTGTFETAGYHTVKLSAPVKVTGKFFSVVAKLQTPGTNFPIPMERPISGYSERALALENQSFVSHDGADWKDLAKQYKNTNVCIKAFAQ